jgi:cytochrome c peroxidase
MLYRIIVILIVFFCLYKATYMVSKPLTSDLNPIQPPLGLAPIPWPKDNVYSKKKADLGRLLYFDKRLSTDGTISCASCHNKPCGFSDCRSLPIGINHAKGTRHSPTVINAAYATHLFWDGRANSLEEQCKGPIGNTKEMTTIKDIHEAHAQCAEKVNTISGYRLLFKEVFGHEQISINEIAQAIATFERTLLSGNSPFDRYQAGDRSALTAEQIQGWDVFKKVGCINCHAGSNFTDGRFLNIGIGMEVPNPDTGRYGITHAEKDWGAFKVPTLREVEHTGPPYMHDGSLKSLEEVVNYYDQGGIKNKNLHPLMRPLHLSTEEKQALVSFLISLSGDGWQDFHEPSQFP